MHGWILVLRGLSRHTTQSFCSESRPACSKSSIALSTSPLAWCAPARVWKAVASSGLMPIAMVQSAIAPSWSPSRVRRLALHTYAAT